MPPAASRRAGRSHSLCSRWSRGATAAHARRCCGARRARCCASRRGRSWLVAGVVLWRRRPRGAAVAAAPVRSPCRRCGSCPEWLGSGDLLRSGERARVSQPGPARDGGRAGARRPARGGRAAAVAPVVRRAVRGRARLRPLLLAGLAWIALVAVMAQAGFSGEPRYSLPGGACVAVAGAGGLLALARRKRSYAIAIALALARRGRAQARRRCRTSGARRRANGHSTRICSGRSSGPAAATRCLRAAARTSGTCAARCSPTASTSRNSGSRSSPARRAWSSSSRLRTDSLVEPAAATGSSQGPDSALGGSG